MFLTSFQLRAGFVVGITFLFCPKVTIKAKQKWDYNAKKSRRPSQASGSTLKDFQVMKIVVACQGVEPHERA